MNEIVKKRIEYLLKHPSVCKKINFSFSQEGEDIIVDSILEEKTRGFYVDFGAYKPDMYSNTLRFYIYGWNGINVDATPGSMDAFRKLRPRDINIECGISDKEGEMIYYQFDEPALNSFDSSVIEPCMRQGYKLVDEKTVSVHTPMYILDRYVPDGIHIDLMDIDIEGYDDIIVDSIDWEKYLPTIVMIEKKIDNRNSALMLNDTLLNYGYNLIACTYRTAIYMHKKG